MNLPLNTRPKMHLYRPILIELNLVATLQRGELCGSIESSHAVVREWNNPFESGIIGLTRTMPVCVPTHEKGMKGKTGGEPPQAAGVIRDDICAKARFEKIDSENLFPFFKT
jgi:hypothetical protein